MSEVLRRYRLLMDQWTELMWEAEHDDDDAYQAAADAAEGERLRVALAKPRMVGLGYDATDPTAELRLAAVLRLHAPEPVPDAEWKFVDWCNECGHAWPCPTAKAAKGDETS